VGRRDQDQDGVAPVSCATAREFISADADDELAGHERAALDGHVAGCSGCAAYRSSVTAISRSTRVRAASIDHGFVDAVLDRTSPARLGRGGWLRPALAWCGMVLAWQSVAPLVFGDVADTPTHVARHVGASTAALAIGLLYVVWRPHRAVGLLPYVGALFGTMFAGAALDVLSGDRSPVTELVHVVELTGMVLLWMIAGSPGWHRVERVVSLRRRGVAPSTS
jgi:predicted anti-sigma-YlaC factor YlaD